MEIRSFILRTYEAGLALWRSRESPPVEAVRLCEFGYSVFAVTKRCSYGHRVRRASAQRSRGTRTRVDANKLLEFRRLHRPLWIRRVLVRAQEALKPGNDLRAVRCRSCELLYE
jgi:hypothetical protein